ncbi:MAG: hypothetical protein M3229_01705, partial [Actinomycetota bacterium]|nr:hypothetical protein [Actinomycetota bacterium]
MLAILAAVVGVTLLIVPASPIHRSPTLGLDLQGGLELVLEANPPPGRELTDEDLDRSVDTIRERIDKLGVNEPDVRKQGERQISVQLAGVFDRQRAVSIIGSTAQLELYKLEANLLRPSIDLTGARPQPSESVFSLLAPVSKSAEANSSRWYLFDDQKRVVAGPLLTRAQLLKTRVLRCATGDLKGEDCRGVGA